MSFARTLFCLALVALVSAASAHHNDVSQGLVSCVGYSNCDGSNMDHVSHDACIMFNVTLGACTQMDAALGGLNSTYGQLFCDNGKAFIASYGSDANCASNSLRTVTVQQADTCAQSNIAVCRNAQFAPPAAITAKAYISVDRCDADSCSGSTCASTYYQTEKCYTDDETNGYSYGKCERQSDDVHTIMEKSWFGGEHSMHCHHAADANMTVSAGQCYTARAGNGFLKYGCGNTVTGAAAFAAPAISVLAMLAALVATLRLSL